MRAEFIPDYLHHGRDVYPERDRDFLVKVIAELTTYGVTRAEIARRANINKVHITRVTKPQMKPNGYRCNISRAYAEAIWRGIDHTCIARNIDIEKVKSVARS
jgi:hypothetical protein